MKMQREKNLDDLKSWIVGAGSDFTSDTVVLRISFNFLFNWCVIKNKTIKDNKNVCKNVL